MLSKGFNDEIINFKVYIVMEIIDFLKEKSANIHLSFELEPRLYTEKSKN